MIALPDSFKYPIAAVVSTNILLVWQVILVENARKRAGIAYPQLYAEKGEVTKSKEAMIFNCVQRAHQNMLENVPLIWSSTLIAGLKYPIAATSLCIFYLLTRVPYTLGYKTGIADNRNRLGAFPVAVPLLATAFEFPLMFLAGWTVFTFYT